MGRKKTELPAICVGCKYRTEEKVETANQLDKIRAFDLITSKLINLNLLLKFDSVRRYNYVVVNHPERRLTKEEFLFAKEMVKNGKIS